MADDGKARPVSGEIMTDAAGVASVGNAVPPPSRDISNAEYETVSFGRRASSADRPASIVTKAAPLAGLDTLRGSGQPVIAAVTARGGPLFWIFGVGLAMAAFWISGGYALVRNAPLPFFSDPTPVSALRISGVTSRVDATGAHAVLFVDGEAANDGPASESLPPLDIVVTGADGVTTRYKLGTGGRALAPGERFAFSSRLGVPKNGVKTVTVTFAE